MSGGDIHVDLDKLRQFADWCQRRIDALDDYIEKQGWGRLRQSVKDPSKFGGFTNGTELGVIHSQLVNDMRKNVFEVRGGLVSAKRGVEQTIKNYHNVDAQRSREFAQIDENADDWNGGQGQP